MSVAEAVFEKLKTLSAEDQQKVLEFVDSLTPCGKPPSMCSGTARYPLRGSVIRFDGPTEPIGEEDWEAGL